LRFYKIRCDSIAENILLNNQIFKNQEKSKIRNVLSEKKKFSFFKRKTREMVAMQTCSIGHGRSEYKKNSSKFINEKKMKE